MGLLIFGILLIVGGGIALGVLYREPKEFLNIVCKIWFTIVISLFMFWGFIMVMYNDIVFNKNIKTYNNGYYTKEIIYDAKGNEIDVRYKFMGVK